MVRGGNRIDLTGRALESPLLLHPGPQGEPSIDRSCQKARTLLAGRLGQDGLALHTQSTREDWRASPAGSLKPFLACAPRTVPRVRGQPARGRDTALAPRIAHEKRGLPAKESTAGSLL